MAPPGVAEPILRMRARKSAPPQGRPIIRHDPQPEPRMRARKTAPPQGRPIIRPDPQPEPRMRARKTAPSQGRPIIHLDPESDAEGKAAQGPYKRTTKSTPPTSRTASGDVPDTEYPAEIIREMPREYRVRWLTPAEDDSSKLKWPEPTWVHKSNVSAGAVATWRRRQKAAVRAAKKVRENQMLEDQQQAGTRRSVRLQQASKKSGSALDKSSNGDAEKDTHAAQDEMEVDGEEDDGF
ncbi:Hypothetical predicted protein [Lecanosticta acicola]|uniref:Uncharacterized protein n=1 Tax=Lecanosticta acicola TaxID=111012 RepID=A0AAI9ED61_9PEZI|nr:Hypothetical predicted protein [Lecanosticta acicola]